jgi:hypothetical protein
MGVKGSCHRVLTLVCDRLRVLVPASMGSLEPHVQAIPIPRRCPVLSAPSEAIREPMGKVGIYDCTGASLIPAILNLETSVFSSCAQSYLILPRVSSNRFAQHPIQFALPFPNSLGYPILLPSPFSFRSPVGAKGMALCHSSFSSPVWFFSSSLSPKERKKKHWFSSCHRYPECGAYLLV